MRLSAETDGRDHASLAATPDDHHPRPASVTINNTSQSLPPGTTYNLDIALPHAGFQFARVQILGAKQMPLSAGNWYECAEIIATTNSAQAIGHSTHDSSFKKVYSVTYSKQVGDAILSHKIFDTNTAAEYIALQDALITGSTLRLIFRNFFGGSATLWVKGQALLW